MNSRQQWEAGSSKAPGRDRPGAGCEQPASHTTYAPLADRAMRRIVTLKRQGYKLDPAGECIRVKAPHGGTRYILIASLLNVKRPSQYTLATFADRW